MSVRKIVKNAFIARLQDTGYYHWIDLWRGQMNGQNKGYPASFPAAYIEISNVNYIDRTMNLTEGDCTVNIYLFFHIGTDTFAGAKDAPLYDAILDSITQTTDALQWMQEETFPDGFTLVSETDISERYNRPAFMLTFTAPIRSIINNEHNYVYN